MHRRAHTPGSFYGFARARTNAAAKAEIQQKTDRTQVFERNRIAVVMIRLARFGARKQPYYRIVAIEKDRARNGAPAEVSFGAYPPHQPCHR